MGAPRVHDGYNTALTEKARKYVRAVHAQTADVPGAPEPRFDVQFEGFGSGGTSGVTVDGALRYLRDLSAPEDGHSRYGTRLKSLTVRVRLDFVEFAD